MPKPVDSFELTFIFTPATVQKIPAHFKGIPLQKEDSVLFSNKRCDPLIGFHLVTTICRHEKLPTF